ncbi:MAG: cholesterol esterase [Hamadaea sp.]|nr:cholesterol esterase [Hamadaea sp.]
MKDSKGTAVQGRTRWRRFAAVVVPAAMVAGGLMTGVAYGKVPVALNVSGKTFKVSADKLVGTGFTQYGSVAVTANGAQVPVAASGIKYAELHNLCQSVVVIPGHLSLLIRAGRGGTPATADNLLIGMDALAGDATFKEINIGTDASKLSQDGMAEHGKAGEFGQEAKSVTIENLKQRAYSTSAGTFALTGLSMSLDMHGTECFADSALD